MATLSGSVQAMKYKTRLSIEWERRGPRRELPVMRHMQGPWIYPSLLPTWLAEHHPYAVLSAPSIVRYGAKAKTKTENTHCY